MFLQCWCCQLKLLLGRRMALPCLAATLAHQLRPHRGVLVAEEGLTSCSAGMPSTGQRTMCTATQRSCCPGLLHTQAPLNHCLHASTWCPCSAMQEAAANAKRLTPALLQSLYIQAIANNTKLYFGDKLPAMLLDQRYADAMHTRRQVNHQNVVPCSWG